MHQLVPVIWGLTFLFLLKRNAAYQRCDTRQYWDATEHICQPCSLCPKNEIIHKPCAKYTDTVCGPFREFSYFNQLKDFDSSFLSHTVDGETESKINNRHAVSTERILDEPMIEKDDGEHWKNLAFALIGVVCVLIFIATIIVLLACRKLHENSSMKKADEEEDDNDSGYVVIRAIRPASTNFTRFITSPPLDFLPATAAVSLLDAKHHEPLPSANVKPVSRDHCPRKAYRPKRRLLNYDADDVFESEDSAGSKTSHKLPLQPIPEKSVSDSENQLSDVEV